MSERDRGRRDTQVKARGRSRSRSPRHGERHNRVDKYQDRDRRRSRSRSPPPKRRHSRSSSPPPKRHNRSDSRPRSTSPRRDRGKEKPRRSRSHSRTRHRRRRSRSSSISSVSSESSEKHKKRRKDKHRRRSKSRDKDRKEKKRARKNKKKTKGASTAQWGKHGIINESNMYDKDFEFRTWLVEERKINPETISRDQTKKEFARFVEDYNTATLPHEKYYDITAFERRMSSLRNGETLPPADDGYDPDADMRAHSSAHKKPSKSAEVDTFMNKEQLQELRRVQQERHQVGKMKAMGMNVGQSFGVRMDGNEFEG